MGRRALLAHTLELGLTRMPVYESMCKEPLMTFEISSELQKSLSLLAFLNPGSASWSWACGKAAHSWADSSCSVSLLCDRPVQIELIAYEFPLACHIGRQIHTWFLTGPSQRHTETKESILEFIWLGLYSNRRSVCVHCHSTHKPEICLGFWQLLIYEIRPIREFPTPPSQF